MGQKNLAFNVKQRLEYLSRKQAENIRSHFTKYSWSNFANRLPEPGSPVHLTNEQHRRERTGKWRQTIRNIHAPGNLC